jgi:hypothetical protein
VRIEDQRPMNSIYSQPGRLNDLVLTIRGVACLPSEWQYESANSAAKCPSNTGENTDRYNQVIMVFGVLSLTLVVCGAIWLVYGRLVRPKLQNISASRRKTILPISAASPRSTEGSFTGRLPNVLLKSPISPKQYLPLDQQIPPPPRRAVIDLIQKSASHSPQMATQNTVKLSDASSPINRPTSPALRRLASSTERLSVRINQPAIDMGQLPSPQVSIPLSTLPINNPSNNNSSQSLPTSSGGQRNNRPTLSRGVDNIIDDDIELQSPKSPQAKADWLLANGKPSGKPFYLRLWK